MSLRLAVLSIALASAVTLAGEPPAPWTMVERVAKRYVLSDSQTIEVLGQKQNSEMLSSDTAYVRAAGEVFVIASRLDRKWGVSEFTITSHKTRISVRTDLNYASDNLPAPVAVLIDGNVYRMLTSPPEKPFEPAAKQRVLEAVNALPAKFLAGLRIIARVAEDPDAGLPFSVMMLGEVIADPIPPLEIISKMPLKPVEVDRLRTVPPEL